MPEKGQGFKNRREELHLTQEDVASAMKVSVRTVANWDAGIGPSKKTAVELERYFNKIVEDRKGGASKGETMVKMDRGFVIETLLRNVLLQIAKDRAHRDGEPGNWKKYLQEIDADTPEVTNDLLQRMGVLKG